MKLFLVFILTETSLTTNSYSYFFFFWSANYANLYILDESRYINIVYMGRFFVLTYIERLFSTVCCFFSYYGRSVNYLSRVSKFHNSAMLRNLGKVYIWGLLVLSYGKFSSNDLAFQCSSLLISKLYELSLWFQRCPEA